MLTLFSLFEIYSDFKNGKGAFTKNEIFISILAVAGHDINHPGNTNLYEINSRSTLSLFYNDKSVLENYHIYCLFNLLNNEQLNIFSSINNSSSTPIPYKEVRKIIISNILSTDMTNHKPDLDKLKYLISSLQSKTKDTNELQELILSDSSNKLLISSELVHFSDISNPTKKFNIYNKWVDMLFDEFFFQGDKEKKEDLPVSFLCDRENTNIPKSQVFFIDFFLDDLVQVFVDITPKFKPLQDELQRNKKKWKLLITN